MRNLLLLLSLLAVTQFTVPSHTGAPSSSSPPSGTTRYVAQTAGQFTGGSACNGQTAITLATWNATNLSPGDTTYACGTITATVNTAGFVFHNSGTSGSPLRLIFDTGAVLQSPAFSGCGDGPGSGGSSAGGGIEVNNYNYIIVDGGLSGSNPQGVIQNTANGTNLANHQCSVGIWEYGDWLIVRNFVVQHIYDQDPSSSNTNGGSSTSIVQKSVNFGMVCNNIFNDSGYGAEMNWADTVYTPATATPSCQSDTFTAHTVAFFNNTLSDHAWMVHGNGTGAPLYFNNDIYGYSNYFLTSFHTHGFFMTGASSATFFPQIFNNYLHGDLNGTSPTGFLYLTDDGATNSGKGQSANIYNNVLYGQGSNVTCCQSLAAQQTSGNPKGPYKFYNNTIVNALYMFEQYLSYDSPTIDWRNNVWYGQSVSYFYHNENGSYAFSTGTFNGSDYFGGRSFGPFGLYQTPASFATWKTNCAAGGGGGGCDSRSVTTDPLLAGESSFSSGGDLGGSGFYTTSGSGAIGIGDNLTSQCSSMVGLCQTPPQTVGAGGSCGTGCVARPSSGAWNAGAY